MSKVLLPMLIALLLLPTAKLTAQTDNPIQIEQLTDHIYKLAYDGGGYTVKIVASIGPDGLLLVDTGMKERADDLKKMLDSLGWAPPKYIVLTHEHGEHIGGTELWGEAPVVIGHTRLRTVLTSGAALFDEWPEAALPEVTFGDSLTLHFNGEDIRLVAFPGCHSDNDIIAWFTGSKVACVGALCNGHDFPSIDGKSGNAHQYAEVTERLKALLPDDTRIIPGHGVDCSMTELDAFHTMLVETSEIVKTGVAAGKTLETLQSEQVLKAYEPWGHSYTTCDGWIQYLVKGLETKDQRQLPYEVMYYTLRDEGLQAGIDRYRRIKTEQADVYRFGERELVVLAYKLLGSQRYDEALAFFEVCVADFPEGAYAGLTCDLIGDTYVGKGDNQQALGFYQKALEINPEDSYAKEQIEALKK